MIVAFGVCGGGGAGGMEIEGGGRGKREACGYLFCNKLLQNVRLDRHVFRNML